MNEFIPVIKDFLTEIVADESWYKNIKKHLNAVILYGSVAKGTNRPDSDIDLLFIVPLKVEEEYTKGEYFFNFRGYEFNIVMRSIEGLKKIASGKHDDFQAEVFRNSYIIWEKDTTTRDLINMIRNK